MTIHAFCQTLLAGFPMEAGLSPGFQPIEGRDEAALRQSVLRDLVVTAERDGEIGLLSGLRALSLSIPGSGCRTGWRSSLGCKSEGEAVLGQRN